MAQSTTHRKIRFNARFNWNDQKPENGFLGVNGEGFANTKITINYKFFDPDSDATVYTDEDGFEYNNTQGGNSETILLT